MERRVFLSRGSALVGLGFRGLWLRGPGLGGLASFVAACGPDSSGRAAGDGSSSPLRVVVRPWADDIVRLARAEPPEPVAYVSMASRQVFVAYEHRDRASWLLDAHISVSTGLWRMPLHGDPPGVPVTPGDPLREFEELDLSAWDPAVAPSIDDVRIVRGRPVARAVRLDCGEAPRGAQVRYRVGPRTVVVSDSSTDVTMREDFVLGGTGLRFTDATCSSRAEVVQLVGWRVRGG